MEIDRGAQKAVSKFNGLTRDDFEVLSVYNQKTDKKYYRFTFLDRNKPLSCIYETIIGIPAGWPRNGDMTIEKEKEVANTNKELNSNDANYSKVKENVDKFYGKDVTINKVHVYETELGYYYVVDATGVQAKYNARFLEKSTGECTVCNFL